MKIFWPRLFLAALTLFLSLACLGIQTVTPAAPGTFASPAAPTQGSSPTTSSSASSPAPVTAAPLATGQLPAVKPLALQVLSPQDGAIVTTAQIQVSGLAAPGEVVTVNDNILLIGADGRFDTTVSLNEGPNLIEVVASNDLGEETTIELTVTYAP